MGGNSVFHFTPDDYKLLAYEHDKEARPQQESACNK